MVCKRRFDWTQLVVAASNRNRELVDPKIPAQSTKGEESGDRERNHWLAKMDDAYHV